VAAGDDPPNGRNGKTDAELLAELLQVRGKLSPEQAVLLRRFYPIIFGAHHDRIWERLRRRGLGSGAEDVFQEVMLAGYKEFLNEGFQDDLAGVFKRITEGMILNHLRSVKRHPAVLGVPSSDSLPPRTPPQPERAIDYKAIAPLVFAQLSEEHQAVVETVILGGLAHGAAAEALGLRLGTLKSRVMAAKKRLYELVVPLLPESQRPGGGRAA
jgi:RNA polymerase sigma-70 factor (ECF subfamily)